MDNFINNYLKVHSLFNLRLKIVKSLRKILTTFVCIKRLPLFFAGILTIHVA